MLTFNISIFYLFYVKYFFNYFKLFFIFLFIIFCLSYSPLLFNPLFLFLKQSKIILDILKLLV